MEIKSAAHYAPESLSAMKDFFLKSPIFTQAIVLLILPKIQNKHNQTRILRESKTQK